MTTTNDVTQTTAAPPKKRRRRGKSDPSKFYFTKDTQAAIVEFQGQESAKLREKIYVERIEPAFSKLVENLINIHKFTTANDTHDALKNDCVTYLFETITKFDAARGSNAFSYFNVVAKNFLIIRVKQKALKQRRYVSLDSPDDLNGDDIRHIDENNRVFKDPASNRETIEEKSVARKRLVKLEQIMTDEDDLLILRAIIGLYDVSDDLDIMTKPAAFMYLREISGLQTKQVSSSVASIKKRYAQLCKYHPELRNRTFS